MGKLRSFRSIFTVILAAAAVIFFSAGMASAGEAATVHTSTIAGPCGVNLSPHKVQYCMKLDHSSSKRRPPSINAKRQMALHDSKSTGLRDPNPSCGDYNDFDPDRFLTCSQITYTETAVTDGQIVGTMPVTVNASATFSPSGTSTTWGLDALITTGVATGELAVPQPTTVTTGCSRSAGICSTYNGSDAKEVTFNSNSSFVFGWSQTDTNNTPGFIDPLEGYLGPIVSTLAPNGQTVEANSATDGYLAGRCDNAVGQYAGCVDLYYSPVVVFNGQTNPTIAPIANNIFNWQHELPSHWGSYAYGTKALLERTTSQSLINANRAVACPNPPPSADVSCDEYSFASTYEGASRVAANDYRSAFVPTGAQHSQGGTLSAFYQKNRVIDRDVYYVLAYNDAGQPSW